MEFKRIAELLQPFLGSEALSEIQLKQISAYLDLLIKWNTRMNLTAVRDPEQMVTRHFGESLFTARQLFPGPSSDSSVIDVGSGAGFPGLAMMSVRPALRLTLVESQGKKAVFLREVGRALGMDGVTVRNVRAETLTGAAEVVTLRAVERFETILPVAARLVLQGGRFALLIGTAQAETAKRVLSETFGNFEVREVPESTGRVLLTALRI